MIINISIKYIIILILTTCFNALAQMMKATSISFSLNRCQTFWSDSTQTNIMGCQFDAYLGTPKQSQTVLFVLNNPLPFTLDGNIQNAFINNQCNVLNYCPYAQNAFDKSTTFYSQLKSRTNQNVGGSFTQMQYDQILVKGNFESDQFYLFSNDQPITISFLSMSQFNYYNYVGNGVIDLSRSNQNNLFALGYQQQKLITPKFTFGILGNSASLLFNRLSMELESVPAVPTRSSDNWDGQIIGFYYGDDDIITYAHYQTFEVQIVPQVYLPWQVAVYLQKKYPDYYSQEEGMYYQLMGCRNCDCLEDSPFEPINVYTQEYLFTFKPEDYFFVSGDTCQTYISSGNLVLGAKDINNFQILFNPLDGTLQFPGATLMKHPEINNMYPIIGFSSAALILLIWFIIYAELNVAQLRKEDCFVKKYL